KKGWFSQKPIPIHIHSFSCYAISIPAAIVAHIFSDSMTLDKPDVNVGMPVPDLKQESGYVRVCMIKPREISLPSKPVKTPSDKIPDYVDVCRNDDGSKCGQGYIDDSKGKCFVVLQIGEEEKSGEEVENRKIEVSEDTKRTLVTLFQSTPDSVPCIFLDRETGDRYFSIIRVSTMDIISPPAPLLLLGPNESVIRCVCFFGVCIVVTQIRIVFIQTHVEKEGKGITRAKRSSSQGNHLSVSRSLAPAVSSFVQSLDSRNIILSPSHPFVQGWVSISFDVDSLLLLSSSACIVSDGERIWFVTSKSGTIKQTVLLATLPPLFPLKLTSFSTFDDDKFIAMGPESPMSKLSGDSSAESLSCLTSLSSSSSFSSSFPLSIHMEHKASNSMISLHINVDLLHSLLFGVTSTNTMLNILAQGNKVDPLNSFILSCVPTQKLTEYELRQHGITEAKWLRCLVERKDMSGRQRLDDLPIAMSSSPTASITASSIMSAFSLFPTQFEAIQSLLSNVFKHSNPRNWIDSIVAANTIVEYLHSHGMNYEAELLSESMSLVQWQSYFEEHARISSGVGILQPHERTSSQSKERKFYEGNNETGSDSSYTDQPISTDLSRTDSSGDLRGSPMMLSQLSTSGPSKERMKELQKQQKHAADSLLKYLKSSSTIGELFPFVSERAALLKRGDAIDETVDDIWKSYFTEDISRHEVLRELQKKKWLGYQEEWKKLCDGVDKDAIKAKVQRMKELQDQDDYFVDNPGALTFFTVLTYRNECTNPRRFVCKSPQEAIEFVSRSEEDVLGGRKNGIHGRVSVARMSKDGEEISGSTPKEVDEKLIITIEEAIDMESIGKKKKKNMFDFADDENDGPTDDFGGNTAGEDDFFDQKSPALKKFDFTIKKRNKGVDSESSESEDKKKKKTLSTFSVTGHNSHSRKEEEEDMFDFADDENDGPTDDFGGNTAGEDDFFDQKSPALKKFDFTIKKRNKGVDSESSESEDKKKKKTLSTFSFAPAPLSPLISSSRSESRDTTPIQGKKKKKIEKSKLSVDPFASFGFGSSDEHQEESSENQDEAEKEPDNIESIPATTKSITTEKDLTNGLANNAKEIDVAITDDKDEESSISVIGKKKLPHAKSQKIVPLIVPTMDISTPSPPSSTSSSLSSLPSAPSMGAFRYHRSPSIISLSKLTNSSARTFSSTRVFADNHLIGGLGDITKANLEKVSKMVKLSMQACVSEDDDELAKKVGMFRLYVKIIIRLKHIMAKKEESQMSHSDMVSPCSSSLDKLSSLALGLLLTSLKLPASLLALRYRLHLLSLTVDMCTKFKLSSLAQRIAPPLQLALQKMKAKMGDQLVSMCEKTMEKYETMIKSGTTPQQNQEPKSGLWAATTNVKYSYCEDFQIPFRYFLDYSHSGMHQNSSFPASSLTDIFSQFPLGYVKLIPQIHVSRSFMKIINSTKEELYKKHQHRDSGITIEEHVELPLEVSQFAYFSPQSVLEFATSTENPDKLPLISSDSETSSRKKRLPFYYRVFGGEYHTLAFCLFCVCHFFGQLFWFEALYRFHSIDIECSIVKKVFADDELEKYLDEKYKRI
ncbi:hypothetical protein ADUPG1_013244, partial [Aduncisulcus paluster]